MRELQFGGREEGRVGGWRVEGMIDWSKHTLLIRTTNPKAEGLQVNYDSQGASAIRPPPSSGSFFARQT